MSVLSGYEPSHVFRFFEEICAIPHGSNNVEKISDYLVQFAVDRNLKYRQDELFNVIIWKEASAGYENSAPVILQGHMDMVAVKTEDCDKNMEEEGLDLEIIDGDMISAKYTSLGGDDGIAVAYALAILDSKDMPHPPIEAVFTVNEEIGMLGAAGIDVSDLKGRLFLNMDSENEGIFTVSCAGGVRAHSVLPGVLDEVNGTVMNIKLEGLKGGHSGVEIDKGRLNANIAMGRLLYEVKDEPVQIIALSGGEKENAIPNSAVASIMVPEEAVETVSEKIAAAAEILIDEYDGVENNMEVTVEEVPLQTKLAFPIEFTRKAVAVLMNIPNGIQRMNPHMEHMVQTSLNLGIVATAEDGIVFSCALRSSVESEKAYTLKKIENLMDILGGYVTTVGDYPGWEYRPDSVLRDTMVEVYKEQYGSEPVVCGIHAGLECGLFSGKLDDLDCISIGPQMQDIHTTNEVLSIASTRRTWELIKATLERLK